MDPVARDPDLVKAPPTPKTQWETKKKKINF